MSPGALEGAVVVVTGGSRGIGREIVLGAVAQGAQVVFCARRVGPEARAVEEEAERLGRVDRAVALRADVACEADVNGLFEAAFQAFARVDVVVNNAAISLAHLLVSTPLEAWEQVIGTNLTGAFLVARRAVRAFLDQGRGGRIISVGSVTQYGAPSNAGYAASKGGLRGLTQSIAREYGERQIQAFLVAGGYADTAIMADAPELRQRVVRANPLARLATPAEIASVVLFLAACQAPDLLNGEVWHVSGGLIDPPVK